MIKDSGNRRTFESGAVRDMGDPSDPATQKGRCDLIPLEVAARIRMTGEDFVLHNVAVFQSTGCTEYLYKSLQCFCKAFYNESYETMLLEVAKHFENGALKYGENNWRKGIPANCYIDSAVRHYLKFRRGDDDENHKVSVVWNIMCCIWEVDYHVHTDEG